MSPRPITLTQLSSLARTAARMLLTFRVRGRKLVVARWAGGEPLIASTDPGVLLNWLQARRRV